MNRDEALAILDLDTNSSTEAIALRADRMERELAATLKSGEAEAQKSQIQLLLAQVQAARLFLLGNEAAAYDRVYREGNGTASSKGRSDDVSVGQSQGEPSGCGQESRSQNRQEVESAQTAKELPTSEQIRCGPGGNETQAMARSHLRRNAGRDSGSNSRTDHLASLRENPTSNTAEDEFETVSGCALGLPLLLTVGVIMFASVQLGIIGLHTHYLTNVLYLICVVVVVGIAFLTLAKRKVWVAPDGNGHGPTSQRAARKLDLGASTGESVQGESEVRKGAGVPQIQEISQHNPDVGGESSPPSRETLWTKLIRMSGLFIAVALIAPVGVLLAIYLVGGTAAMVTALCLGGLAFILIAGQAYEYIDTDANPAESPRGTSALPVFYRDSLSAKRTAEVSLARNIGRQVGSKGTGCGCGCFAALFCGGATFVFVWKVVHDVVGGGGYFTSIDTAQSAMARDRQTSTVIAAFVAVVVGLIIGALAKAIVSSSKNK